MWHRLDRGVHCPLVFLRSLPVGTADKYSAAFIQLLADPAFFTAYLESRFIHHQEILFATALPGQLDSRAEPLVKPTRNPNSSLLNQRIHSIWLSLGLLVAALRPVTSVEIVQVGAGR